MSEPTIKQLLADMGIEVRKIGDGPTRELWRGAEFLGHFHAHTAVERFLPGASA
jgi:hypothetical protein